ncbi:LuxR C-terminal-related transcriptional regulator [Nonomuraea sp. NPDC049269]|uniref:helix-turn-helix transcriptional regulator n=1 Tax=Nonomuraea sp. NPDC049269 TaxID=3364349 RepID=UPI00371306E4
MSDDPPAEADRLAQALYERVHTRGESVADASAALGLTARQRAAARDRLVRLGLLIPGSELSVETSTALALSLEHGHRALDKLVEQHVLTASLARDYLGLAQRPHDDTQVEFYPRQERATRLNQRLNELAEMARHEIVGMHPAATWSARGLDGGTERTKISLGRGVRIRSIHAQITLSDPLMRDHLRDRVAEGVEVRVAPVVPTRMLVYDRRVAVVQADPEDVGAGAVLIRGANVVRSLATIYDYLWLTASEPQDVPRSADGTALTEQQRAVLLLLAAGTKDDVIARRLGVSTRTVTRLVGELTTMLGASSRFQAGVRAARLGWLD